MNHTLTTMQGITSAPEPKAAEATLNSNTVRDENAAAVLRVQELVAIYLYCPRVNLLDLCL